MNDFRDNLVPLDGWSFFHEDDGSQNYVRRFQYNRWGIPVEVRPEFVFAYTIRGRIPPVSEAERVVGLTRLGTLALRLQDKVVRLSIDESLEHRRQITRRHLTQLRDSAAALDSRLLVLLVPRTGDIGDPGEEYLSAIQLMQELEIPYLNPIDMLDPVADYAAPPDGHWNNAGHQVVGALLAECMSQAFMPRAMDLGRLRQCGYAAPIREPIATYPVIGAFPYDWIEHMSAMICTSCDIGPAGMSSADAQHLIVLCSVAIEKANLGEQQC